MARLDQNMIIFDDESHEHINNKNKRVQWTHETFANAMRDVNEHIELLSEYVNMKTKIRCRCTRCGLEWECVPDLILNRGRGCKRCDGKNKIARDAFLEKLSNVHPTLHLCGTYIDSKTPVRCGCDVCGYEFEITTAGLWKSSGCPKCTGTCKRTRDDLIEELKTKNPMVELIGDYVNTQVKTEWRCKNCGTRFQNRPSKILLGQACPECKKQKIGDALRKPHEVFVKEMAELLPSLTVTGTYKNCATKIACHCNVCGTDFEALPTNLRKQEGCPKCGLRKLAERNRKTHEQFVSEMSIVNDRIKIVGKYNGDATKIECECLNCERHFSSWPSNLLKRHGCRHCTRNQTSFMERAILMALEQTLEKGDVVARDHEQIGEELDIYIKSLNTAIEPGGWFWHCNRMTKDTERYNLCRQKGIRLIIIFDGFNGDRSSLEFDNDDLWTYSINLGDKNNRTELISCIKRIFKELGLNYNFSDDEEKSLLSEAKLSVSRRKTSDVVEELAAINENIELLGHYEDEKTKMKCRCKICNNLWEVDYDHLIRRRHGCPKCHSPHKQVVNLDTGEVFESATAAAKHLRLTPSAIGIACRNGTKCNKHHWAYLLSLSESQLSDLRTQFPNTFNY
jgi:predicted Zn-ribbon and HTH transcriptional regulator